MPSELLSFQIKLSGTYWDKLPEFSVWLDDQKIDQNILSSKDCVVNFEQELCQGDHFLKIRLENKDQRTDTIVEDGAIIKDLLLNIEDIIIDDISIGGLLWTAEYLLDEPQEYQGKTISQLNHCVNLGWNGTYILKFSSPFYRWLLEKL